MQSLIEKKLSDNKSLPFNDCQLSHIRKSLWPYFCYQSAIINSPIHQNSVNVLGLIEIILFYSVIVKPLCSEYLFSGCSTCYLLMLKAKARIYTINLSRGTWREGEKCIKPRIPFSFNLNRIQGCQTASNASFQVASFNGAGARAQARGRGRQAYRCVSQNTISGLGDHLPYKHFVTIKFISLRRRARTKQERTERKGIIK